MLVAMLAKYRCTCSSRTRFNSFVTTADYGRLSRNDPLRTETTIAVWHTTFIFFEMLAARNMNASSQYTVTQNLHVSPSDRNAIHHSINQLLRLCQNSLPRTTELAAQRTRANNLLAARVLRFRAIPVVSFIVFLQSPSITPVYYYKGQI